MKRSLRVFFARRSRFVRSAVSLRRLVWIGFALTILPLVIIILSAIYSFGTVSEYSQRAVYLAVRTTQESRILVEKLTVMERSIKQYLVLEDPVLLRSYEKGHDDFVVVLRGLIELAGKSDLWEVMETLASDEATLFQQMVSTRLNKEDRQRAAGKFRELNSLAHQLWRNSTMRVSQGVERLDKKSNEVQKRLFLQSSILLPISIVLVLVFVYLIIQPIRQLDTAIRGLGGGNFERRIKVKGPRDLEYLGDRLDWLRIRLKNLEEGKQRFLRNVSHELKTPLASIHEGAELLIDEVVGELNREQADIADILADSSNKLDRLIGDLLRYSQLQSQEGKLNPEFIDMRRLVRAVVKDQKIQLRSNKLGLNSRLDSVKVFADADKMRVIVDNLLSNAVKYSPKGGNIDISLYARGDFMQFEIEDEGPGISLGERERIFEVFYQGRVARESSVKGSGLGLAIVSESVALHRGFARALPPRRGKNGAFLQIGIPFDFRKIR